MNGLWKTVTENFVFVLEFVGVIALMFLVAIAVQKAADKKRGVKRCFISLIFRFLFLRLVFIR